ncbi:MAG: nucleotidyltransferase family protein [Acidobacteriaceae bacterium]|nr:nucleotidyltransferase family protein [Acidobacteriaceae bacterium]
MPYGDILLRHAGDLDLVIHPADLPRVRLLLENLGYAAKAAAPRPGGYHLGFRCASSGVTAELHWAFTSPRWPFPLSGACGPRSRRSRSRAVPPRAWFRQWPFSPSVRTGRRRPGTGWGCSPPSPSPRSSPAGSRSFRGSPSSAVR